MPCQYFTIDIAIFRLVVSQWGLPFFPLFAMLILNLVASDSFLLIRGITFNYIRLLINRNATTQVD